MQIHGRWYFKPVRWLDIGPAAVDLTNVDVSWGPSEPWISGATGRLAATVHPGDVRGYSHGRFLDYVSLAGPASGTLQLSTIRRPPPERSTTCHVSPVDAPFALDAEIDHGVISGAGRSCR